MFEDKKITLSEFLAVSARGIIFFVPLLQSMFYFVLFVLGETLPKDVQERIKGNILMFCNLLYKFVLILNLDIARSMISILNNSVQWHVIRTLINRVKTRLGTFLKVLSNNAILTKLYFD